MSRSLFERVALAGLKDRLAGTIVVARMDVAAQNHAVAEGHPDPYPRPGEQGSRALGRGRERESLPRGNTPPV